MVQPGDNFDDLGDDEPFSPLLPPEDRLWRHPSELSGAIGEPPIEQVMAARSRWLDNTPSRAGAGAAGLVGAVLAAGVVLVGVHLTSWLTPHPKTAAVGAQLDYTTPSTLPPIKAVGLAGFFNSLNAAIVKVRAVVGPDPVLSDGVVISQNGYVLVAARSIAGAMSVSVLLSDGEELPATVVGTDRSTGLAVLRIPEPNLTWLSFSPSSRSPVGSFLVSAWKSRKLAMELVSLSRAPSAASIDGGPLLLERCPASLHLGRAPDGAAIFDSAGQVIGFVTAHADGHALAIPGWLAVRVADALIAVGHVAHGWLGIVGRTTALSGNVLQSIRSLQPGVVASGSSLSSHGVRVMSVSANSAAARAGLREGDVIEAVDGRPVPSMGALRAVLYLMSPGSSVNLEVVRGNRLTDMSVRLQAAV